MSFRSLNKNGHLQCVTTSYGVCCTLTNRLFCVLLKAFSSAGWNKNRFSHYPDGISACRIMRQSQRKLVQAMCCFLPIIIWSVNYYWIETSVHCCTPQCVFDTADVLVCSGYLNWEPSLKSRETDDTQSTLNLFKSSPDLTVTLTRWLIHFAQNVDFLHALNFTQSLHRSNTSSEHADLLRHWWNLIKIVANGFLIWYMS